jgi:hypothetical protein
MLLAAAERDQYPGWNVTHRSVMVRLDRAIGSNAMNTAMARSSRAMTGP